MNNNISNNLASDPLKKYNLVLDKVQWHPCNQPYLVAVGRAYCCLLKSIRMTTLTYIFFLYHPGFVARMERTPT